MPSLQRSTSWVCLLIACALPFVMGCDGDALSDASPRGSSVDPLFDRYVSMGNSITAGFQANGINATTQQESYAVLLADQMETPFSIPTIRDPGCPPPVANILTGELVGAVSGGCSFRSPTAPLVINNVAVPGAQTLDLLTNDPSEGGNPNPLTSLILGDNTQVEAAIEANPTFASLWIGNNDVLGAALAGAPALITPPSEFETQYTDIVDRLQDSGVQGGALMGVADVSLIPALSPGAAYFAVAQADGINQLGQQIAAADTLEATSWGSVTVDASCSPAANGAARVPLSFGFQGLFQLALYGEDVTLDCNDNRPLLQQYPVVQDTSLTNREGFNVSDGTKATSLLTSSELTQVTDAVDAYNAFIEQLASDRGWAYVDANPFLQALYLDGTNTPDPTDDAVPKFPTTSTPTFGQFFSEDGVHPSGDAHRVVTNIFVDAINDRYDTSLSTINAPDVPSPQQP